MGMDEDTFDHEVHSTKCSVGVRCSDSTKVFINQFMNLTKYIEPVYKLDDMYIDMIYSLNTLRWCLILYTATAITSTWLIQTLVKLFLLNHVSLLRYQVDPNICNIIST